MLQILSSFYWLPFIFRTDLKTSLVANKTLHIKVSSYQCNSARHSWNKTIICIDVNDDCAIRKSWLQNFSKSFFYKISEADQNS